MWVVKIGGSLFDSPRLSEWLQVLAGDPDPVVIVPGGGAFADQVREAQRRWAISDRAAHRMALLAMDQFGELCCALDARWQALRQLETPKQAVGDLDKCIWLPSQTDPDVERSWRVTSDSLAAWLAARLDAQGLLIVKSAPVDTDNSAQLLDEAFGEYADRLSCPVRLINRDHSSTWRSLFA